MCNKSMVQLHTHSSFSLLDGASSIKKIVSKAKEFGHPALALTDHGNPAGLFDFAKECKKQGIKPILGLEFYINNDLRSRVSHKDRLTVEERDYHQSVYIKNKNGYKNFNKLTYISQTDGYYYKPRIDFDALFENKEGLMITSSCMASKIGNYVRENNHKDAEQLFKRYALEFDKDFYGEIQFNEINGQKEINDFVIHLCNKYDIPIIIGGDVHYAEKEDNLLQDAIIRSKRDASADDWTIDARGLYFHDTPDYYEFNKKLGYGYDTKFLEKCFENSIEFSNKVNFEFETGKYHYPKIDTGKLTSREYLSEMVYKGIKEKVTTTRKYFPNKYSNEDIDNIEKQIEYELNVYEDLGVTDYMIIVSDIIQYCKENNIYVGPGRGSAAGACSLWGTGVTGLNPIEHKLIFERFVNPNRKVAADIDADFENGGRDKVLEYLISKYGADSVCGVVTFGTYKPKSSLQAMSRGLRKDTGQDSILMRKITKLDGLEDAEDLDAYFKNIYKKTPDEDIRSWIENNQDVISYGQKLMGQISQLGTHAGGIVVTNGPLYNYIPVTRGGSNMVTAFKEADGSSKDLSELGILKLDILGLGTLNILKECVTSIKKDTGIDLEEQIYYLDLTDKNILEYFSKGNNYGIFQMERSKMFTEKIAIDSFDDIVAINAINRPGPLEKFLDKYGYWKEIDKGEIKLTVEELEKVNKERYPFEFMKKALGPTYGCLLYQEQFMQLVCDVTGMSFGEADSFRRAIAWKEDNPKYYTVKGYFDRLEESMLLQGYTIEQKNQFLEYCRGFMGYSFNLSHATCLTENCIIEKESNEKVSIKNVEIGDKVLCYNEKEKINEYKKVVNVLNQGIKKCYKIKTESGKMLEATGDHLILCEDGNYHKLEECIKNNLKIKVK